MSTPPAGELRRGGGWGRAPLPRQTPGQGSRAGSRCTAGAASLPGGSLAAARPEHPPPGSLRLAPWVAPAQHRTGVPGSTHLLGPPQALRCRRLLGQRVRGGQWDPAGPGHRHRAWQGPAPAAAACGTGHSPSQKGLRGDADALRGASSPQDAQGRAAAPVLGRAVEAEGAQQQPQVEQDAGPARAHLHPEGRPAAVCEGGLQHRVLVAGGRGQALGARGMPTPGSQHRLQPPGHPNVPAAACPRARPTCHGAPWPRRP